jgi:hypothetical protein
VTLKISQGHPKSISFRVKINKLLALEHLCCEFHQNKLIGSLLIAFTGFFFVPSTVTLGHLKVTESQ